jgi:signal peptidase I
MTIMNRQAASARALTLIAPGLGHFALGRTWRALVVGLPFLLLTQFVLNLVPVAGERLPHLLFFYAWFWLCYQAGVQWDLFEVLAGGPRPSPGRVAIVGVLLMVYALPLGSGAFLLAQRRVGLFQEDASNLYPLIRPGEWVLFRRTHDPSAGDLVVFRHQANVHAARVVGVPGDRVKLDGGRLEVNGTRLARERVGALVVDGEDPRATTLVAWQEALPEGGYLVYTDPDVTVLKSDTIYLERGHFFLMCDNRDAPDCVDSRTLGPLDARELLGSPTHVAWSDQAGRIGFALFARASLTFVP